MPILLLRSDIYCVSGVTNIGLCKQPCIGISMGVHPNTSLAKLFNGWIMLNWTCFHQYSRHFWEYAWQVLSVISFFLKQIQTLQYASHNHVMQFNYPILITILMQFLPIHLIMIMSLFLSFWFFYVWLKRMLAPIHQTIFDPLTPRQWIVAYAQKEGLWIGAKIFRDNLNKYLRNPARLKIGALQLLSTHINRPLMEH